MHRGVLYQLELLDPDNTRYELETIDLNQYPEDEAQKKAIAAAKPDIMIGPDTSRGHLRVKQMIDDLRILTVGPNISTDKAYAQKDTVFRLTVTLGKIASYVVDAMKDTFQANIVQIATVKRSTLLEAATSIHQCKGSLISTDWMITAIVQRCFI